MNIAKLLNFYHNELINDVVPFWEKNSVDWQHGGFLDYLDRNGKPLSRDKGGWVQGRAVWIFSTLCKEIEARNVWRNIAANGVQFIRNSLRRPLDGRVYFEVTCEGKPLVMRRYLFSEIFASIGLAAYSEISDDKDAFDEAKELYQLILKLDGTLESKIDPETRPMRGHSMTMMLISLCQILRSADPENSDGYNRKIDQQIDELFTYFVKEEKKVLLETVGIDGEAVDGPEGRCVNPGHVIETAWFLLEEARHRGDDNLMHKALPLIDWSLDIGWDSEYGGLFSFVDCDGLQPAQIEWEMKYWWPHCESVYALLLAYHMTGDDSYRVWFERMHEYTWSHFPDRECGEWFGYLRRDGTVQVDLKGNHYKGPFHIPRFLIKMELLLKEMLR